MEAQKVGRHVFLCRSLLLSTIIHTNDNRERIVTSSFKRKQRKFTHITKHRATLS